MSFAIFYNLGLGNINKGFERAFLFSKEKTSEKRNIRKKPCKKRIKFKEKPWKKKS